jgi:NADPH:quinone reductase-like Zn-dependent oxidoreductase
MQRMLLTLLDGTTVFIRPIEPKDKALLVAGLRNLSPETAYRRFTLDEIAEAHKVLEANANVGKIVIDVKPV